ncbi:WD40-repeat-containing domain protein [Cladochytrium replicatum]|nr:WD40-repeat-containing domain protein [Cladochytrium replicatum]
MNPGRRSGKGKEPVDINALSTNGHLTTADPKVESIPIREEELMRVICQALFEHGYSKSAQLLQDESGYRLESSTVTRLRAAVIAGEWEIIEQLIPAINIGQDSAVRVKFSIRRQKFLELLERNSVHEALHVLQTEISPLNIHMAKLRLLASLLMCENIEEVKRMADWDGADGISRHRVLLEIQKYIPSSLLIPGRRLETLLGHAIRLQETMCAYHTPDDEHISLYSDHSCDHTPFPFEATHIFDEHSDEVWFIAFSHDGSHLASSSKDDLAIIWSVDQVFRPVHILSGHDGPISFVAWSPDDKYLLTGSSDKSIKLWNAKTGYCENTFSHHMDAVMAVAWLPDGKRFVSGSHDMNLILWSVSGEILHKWTGSRITDLAVSPDGMRLVAIIDKRIRIYSLADKSEMTTFQEKDDITSICLAKDGRHALVNLSNKGIHLWDLDEMKMIRQYTGQKQGRFVIRSCFAGSDQRFVVSGSEGIHEPPMCAGAQLTEHADAKIYVWHRNQSKALEILPGHTGCVNCVSWNPRLNMLASASDDGTIRIWQPKRLE